MQTITSITPLLAVVVSLAVVPLIVVSKRPNVREGWSFVAAVAKFLLVASMLPAVLGGKEIAFTVAEVLPEIAIRFRVDSLGLLFALVSSFLWIVTTAYSIGYMRALKEHGQTRYFCFFAMALSATVGVAFAANLLTLYLFYEMLSFATYPLVTHHQDEEARSAGRKYLAFIVGTSIAFVLPAMILCFDMANTLEFSKQGFLSGTASRATMVLLLVLFVFGFAKAAIMPLHAWLPAAMVAPTPVSALLHAVAVVKVGVFSIVRVLTGVFGIDFLASIDVSALLSFVVSVTIIVASLVALSQDGLKRRLAFSTIAQLSYVVLGVALLSPKALLGGIIHIVLHAFGKITLFFCAGAILVGTGKKNISEMSGIGKRMPITMVAFFIGSLSIIGLPPLGGFISKWCLVLGSLEANQMPVLVVLLVSSLLNAAYFMPIVYHAFFSPLPEGVPSDRVHEWSSLCVIPLVITSAVSIALFFYPQPFYQLATMAVRAMTGG